MSTKAPFKTADPTPSQPPRPKPAIDWQDIATVPRDGSRIRLTADLEVEIPAVWKKARRFDGARWVTEGHWIDPVTRARVEIEPVGWAA